MTPVSPLVTREKLITTARTLPAAPQVLAQLGKLLQDVNTELDQISNLLKKDAALAARVIRISNSAAAGGGVRIGSVEEAVNRVGFGEVYRLVGIATTGRMADRDLNCYQVNAEQLRLHMLYSALSAEALAQRCGLDPRDAYTAGLMRVVGMMVIDRTAKERMKAEDYYDFKKYPGYSAWEGSLFGVTNCDVAAIILNEWKFPVETSNAIRDHYLLRPTDMDNRLACLINVASYMTMMAGLGLTGEPMYWENHATPMQVLGVTEEDLEGMKGGIDAAYERAKNVG